jgi:ABC-2 type transport system permease protein
MKLQWRLAALKNGLLDATAYRIEFLFELFGSAVVPAGIQMMLWYALFDLGGATEVAGMTYHDLILYTIVSTLFSQVRGGNHDFELQEMIRSGGLSNYLLRPVGVVEFVYIRGVAPKLFTALICLVLGNVVGFFFDLNPLRVLGGMLLALIGNIIHYQIGAALATTAFVWEEAYGVLMVKNMVVQFLSGELLPLTLFPEKWSWIWKSTPFYLFVYGPTQFATGKWSIEEFGFQLLVAMAWMFACSFLVHYTWKWNIKRYQSLGG